ncbi:MAG: hypothetical protein V4479_03885, partial [Actinomycetota bacterium]
MLKFIGLRSGKGDFELDEGRFEHLDCVWRLSIGLCWRWQLEPGERGFHPRWAIEADGAARQFGCLLGREQGRDAQHAVSDEHGSAIGEFDPGHQSTIDFDPMGGVQIDEPHGTGQDIQTCVPARDRRVGE